MFIENGIGCNAHPSRVLCTGVVWFYESERRSLHPSGERPSKKLISIDIAPLWGGSRKRQRLFAML